MGAPVRPHRPHMPKSASALDVASVKHVASLVVKVGICSIGVAIIFDWGMSYPTILRKYGKEYVHIGHRTIGSISRHFSYGSHGRLLRHP